MTGKSKSTQARVSLSVDIFDLYSCECTNDQADQGESAQGDTTGQSIAFVVQLQVLLGCLNLHGQGQSAETTVASLYYSVWTQQNEPSLDI